ncbi:MAG TPA: acetate kinase, partial [Candidatus Glassbacteria bacterium]|nr:acetate kinase [Candidatus Glassbacteria bacterium]
MLILVINCGSSSVKYQLIRTDSSQALAKGSVDRIGMSGAVLSIERLDGYKSKFGLEILDHTVAIEQILTYLQHPKHGVIKDKSEVEAVGHRVVHGGQTFTSSVLIDEEVLAKIRQCIDLAPLHNPHNIRGINAALRNLPGVPRVAVFDTAFHSTLPPHAYLYPLPYVLYRRYEIRRYGFHGTSHYYVFQRAVELLGRPAEELKVITAHLGNGCSITAIDRGRSVDTSMGLTPLEGLVMGTRCGDIDPSIILHVMGREELNLSEANTLLNKHSGLQGLSGVSSDVRDLIEEMEKGNEHARLAIEVYCYRLK